MSKETAFYPQLAGLTDQWMDLFGYYAPLVVTDTLEEYRACREAAALMDFSMLRKVDLDGAGALALVNGIVTRNVSKLTPGQIAYGALCDENGKMIDDCTTMLRGPDRVRFCGANDRDHELFTAAAEGTGITVREHTDSTPHLCVQGPRSREILQGLTRSDISNAAFPYYTFREDVEIAGIPVFMTRLGYGRARLRALGRARPERRALGRSGRRRRSGGDEGDRHGRARPLPHRGRLHHRRDRVRLHRLAVRVRARLGGRPRQGRLPGPCGSRARPGPDGAAPDERRPRVGRRRGERRPSDRRRRRRRARHPGGRVSVPRGQDARAREDPQGSPRAGRPDRRDDRRPAGRRRGRPPSRLRPGAQAREES